VTQLSNYTIHSRNGTYIEKQINPFAAAIQIQPGVCSRVQRFAPVCDRTNKRPSPNRAAAEAWDACVSSGSAQAAKTTMDRLCAMRLQTAYLCCAYVSARSRAFVNLKSFYVETNMRRHCDEFSRRRRSSVRRARSKTLSLRPIMITKKLCMQIKHAD
jgi:hypothetical protein